MEIENKNDLDRFNRELTPKDHYALIRIHPIQMVDTILMDSRKNHKEKYGVKNLKSEKYMDDNVEPNNYKLLSYVNQ